MNNKLIIKFKDGTSKSFHVENIESVLLKNVKSEKFLFSSDCKKRVGLLIRKARKKASLSQAKLAEMTGVSTGAISAIENHYLSLSYTLAKKFAEILDIADDEIFPYLHHGDMRLFDRKSLISARIKSKLSQADLSKNAHVSLSEISYLETGKREKIRYCTAKKIADALNIDVKSLFL